ncbi:LOW QUALITY PROTEIN: elongation factor G-like [Schistocerca gregaria]|uniref:LOW QUALITY PROTEIN: elongation factor G-like n=1 Tax=Schistocerca gregaria TaxID=7010 RepID=UPI00211EDFC8|nr:LOW QUALITY PROTEIN: elongation factor G-like [Schistocerca gregaria]
MVSPRVAAALCISAHGRPLYAPEPSLLRHRARSGAASSLAGSRRGYAVEFDVDASCIRNVGIIAHVDAGKTTTSERMLFYSGESSFLGDVDKGDTMLDYLKIERERGITVNAAVITFLWKNHLINLVDTPGHVDFTAEVERSLKVLDGAVAIFDAVAGVQAQTETVWRQASRQGIPRIAYLNKMDREGATLERCLESMKEKLDVNPIVLQKSVGHSKNFRAIVDLVTMQLVEWDDSTLGQLITRKSVSACGSEQLEQTAKDARRELIEKIASMDDAFMEHVFAESREKDVEATPEELRKAIRRVSLAGRGVPVLMGASLRNMGVQPLMDAVVDYLPSPLDVGVVSAQFAPSSSIKKKKTASVRPSAPRDATEVRASRTVRDLDETDAQGEPVCVPCCAKSPLVAQVFKLVHDQRMNCIVSYIRVYSGVLCPGQKLLNVSQHQQERVTRINRVYADQYHDVHELSAGDIGAISGLKSTCTGDTLIALNHPQPVLLPSIHISEPVFISSILADSTHEETPLRDALNFLALEDPSFHWYINQETGQWTIKCMGELHLQVIKDRLARHYKVHATIGNVQIAYKSTLDSPISSLFNGTYVVAGKPEQVALDVSLTPLESGSGAIFEVSPTCFSDHLITKKNANRHPRHSPQRRKRHHKKRHHPRIPHRRHPHSRQTSPLLPHRTPQQLKLCLIQAVSSLSKQAGISLLEPIMLVEITVDNQYNGALLTNLTFKKRATIQTIEHGGPNKKIIRCLVPLAELLGYSTELRSISKGTASFTMEFKQYKKLTHSQQQKILN